MPVLCLFDRYLPADICADLCPWRTVLLFRDVRVNADLDKEDARHILCPLLSK